MGTVYIIRGLPGSGKTTLAGNLSNKVIAMDDYFTSDQGYIFDPEKLMEAVNYCKAKFHEHLATSEENIAVANTFSRRFEMQPYITAAENSKFKLVVIDLYDGGLSDEQLFERNVHGVPIHTINNMRSRWEFGYKGPLPNKPYRRKSKRVNIKNTNPVRSNS